MCGYSSADIGTKAFSAELVENSLWSDEINKYFLK
jgi:hypothetical protein